MRRLNNPVDEIHDLSKFLEGVAALAALSGDKSNAEKFARAAEWLEQTSDSCCGAGFVGCEGGRDCSSDHK